MNNDIFSTLYPINFSHYVIVVDHVYHTCFGSELFIMICRGKDHFTLFVCVCVSHDIQNAEILYHEMCFLFVIGMYVVLDTCHAVAGVEKADALSFVSAQRYGIYLIFCFPVQICTTLFKDFFPFFFILIPFLFFYLCEYGFCYS